MTETVYVLVLGEEEYIDAIGGVYKHEERCNEAIAEIEHSGLWDGPDQWVDCQRYAVHRGKPHGWRDDDGNIDLGGVRG